MLRKTCRLIQAMHFFQAAFSVCLFLSNIQQFFVKDALSTPAPRLNLLGRLDDIIDDVGMDQTMLLEFSHFGMKVTCGKGAPVRGTNCSALQHHE